MPQGGFYPSIYLRKCHLCVRVVPQAFKNATKMTALIRMEPVVKLPRASNYCSYCDKAFKSRGGLSRHQNKIHQHPRTTRRGSKSVSSRDRIEHPPKPFHCPYCNTGFKIRSSLFRHQKAFHQQSNKPARSFNTVSFGDENSGTQVGISYGSITGSVTYNGSIERYINAHHWSNGGEHIINGSLSAGGDIYINLINMERTSMVR